MNLFRIFQCCFYSSFIFLIACDPSTNRVDLDQLISPSALPYTKNAKLYQVASTDSAGLNNDRITIGKGETATILNVTGPGVITRIWFTVDSRDSDYLRKIVLQMFWDDETEPSVNVPLGDFFGCGFEYRQYISQYLGMTSGGFICYFPMPFEKSARIRIVNETNEEIYAFYYQINYLKLEGYLDRSIGYFHAAWNRDIRTDHDSDYTILRAEGRGHVVGVNLNIQSYDREFSFLEGNEAIYVDGEKKPAIVGTGTEDYFSGGWYFNKGEFSGPYHGLILKDDSLGRVSAYRLHILDPIPFKRNILFTIEHGHGNTVIADYSSTVYWYQIESHHKISSLPKASMRIPLHIITPVKLIEAEDLTFDLGDIESELMDVSNIGPDWSGGNQFLLKTKQDDRFSLKLTNLFETSYQIDLFYSRGPDYGNVDLFVDNRIVGHISGYAPDIQLGEKVSISELVPRYGHITIDFQVTGHSLLSKGTFVGLDGIAIYPKRTFIPDWLILGPFPNPRITETQRFGLDSIYEPEQFIDTNKIYSGLNGKPIRWSYVKTPDNGYISLLDQINPSEQVVSYAVTYIYSREKKSALVLIGSDDGSKVFFNGREVYRFLGIRIAEPDQAEIPVHLQMGWNQLLIKIENNLGGYAFYARILDPGKSLYYSAEKIEPPESWLEKR